VVRGIAERLVDVAGNVRMEADHLADGHDFSLFTASLAKQVTPSFLFLWIESPLTLLAVLKAVESGSLLR